MNTETAQIGVSAKTECRFEKLRAEAADREDFVLLLIEDYSRRLLNKENPDACAYLALLDPDEREEFKDGILMDAVLSASL